MQVSLPKNILFPVDFSDRCRAVWPAVAGMGRELRVPVTLFHALDIQHLEPANLLSELEKIRAHIREKLHQFPTPDLEAPNVRRELVEGPAAACIVERAANMEAPLIMMPTRGHTRFRQLLLGSVTAAVLHDAACPVWTEAHTEAGPETTGVYHSMVCAIDMEPRTPTVLQAASQFSSHFGASLHVVHSVPGIDPRFPSGAANRAHAFLIDKAREDFPVHCQKAGVVVPLEIVEDVGLVNGIMGATARHRADLLIIGRGVIQGPLGRLRTNAHEIIRRSPCAVLSV
jgi:nucleotide-binding universal stress UspA family protein